MLQLLHATRRHMTHENTLQVYFTCCCSFANLSGAMLLFDFIFNFGNLNLFFQSGLLSASVHGGSCRLGSLLENRCFRVFLGDLLLAISARRCYRSERSRATFWPVTWIPELTITHGWHLVNRRSCSWRIGSWDARWGGEVTRPRGAGSLPVSRYWHLVCKHHNDNSRRIVLCYYVYQFNLK